MTALFAVTTDLPNFNDCRIISFAKSTPPITSTITSIEGSLINLNGSLVNNLLTDDPFELINDPSIDVIVEVMGGVDLAKDIILRSLNSGKSVVTANKAVIARYGEEIYRTAAKEGVYILSEAAVCGGIPTVSYTHLTLPTRLPV